MALYDDLTVVLGHVDDTKLPVEFLLLNTCSGENIDAEVFLLGGSKVGDVHINGDRTSGNTVGQRVTVNINLSTIPIGDKYSIKFSTPNAGVVGKAKLVVFAEDAFSTVPLSSATVDYVLNLVNGGFIVEWKSNIQYPSGPVVIKEGNNLYIYSGTFPFTTSNFANELAQGLWIKVGGTGDTVTKTFTSSSNSGGVVWSGTTLTVTHDLARHPSVTIVDSGGNQIFGDVKYNNNNEVALTFNAAFGGTVYFN